MTELFTVKATDPYFGFYAGRVTIRVHDKSQCAGQSCTIHNPSSHHMVTWEQVWRADRGMMERICPCHGVGHPDPDEIRTSTVHGCHGCCAKQ